MSREATLHAIPQNVQTKTIDDFLPAKGSKVTVTETVDIEEDGKIDSYELTLWDVHAEPNFNDGNPRQGGAFTLELHAPTGSRVLPDGMYEIQGEKLDKQEIFLSATSDDEAVLAYHSCFN